jgi:hypothetical protein
MIGLKSNRTHRRIFPLGTEDLLSPTGTILPIWTKCTSNTNSIHREILLKFSGRLLGSQNRVVTSQCMSVNTIRLANDTPPDTIIGTDDPILFAVLGKISPDGTYCAPDSGWNGRKVGQAEAWPLSGSKIKLMLVPIPQPGFEERFHGSIGFLRTLTNDNNVHDKKDLLCGDPNVRACIPISHPLFEAADRAMTKYPKTVWTYITESFKQGKCPLSSRSHCDGPGRYLISRTGREMAN